MDDFSRVDEHVFETSAQNPHSARRPRLSIFVRPPRDTASIDGIVDARPPWCVATTIHRIVSEARDEAQAARPTRRARVRKVAACESLRRRIRGRRPALRRQQAHVWTENHPPYGRIRQVARDDGDFAAAFDLSPSDMRSSALESAAFYRHINLTVLCRNAAPHPALVT